MDFGVVVSSNKQPSPTTEPRDENRHGSANLKHQRSEFADDSWRLPKMPKPGDEVDSTSESFTAFGRSTLWPSPADDGQKMLSFSSAEPRGGDGGGGGSSRSIAFSICQDEHHSRTGGGGLNGGVRGPFGRLKGPFTPSQWMELEHQALIYKHIVANVPVPSNLLVPLKRSLYAYGSYASNLLGWGPFHLGYSGSNDPEPGRCRRTDGKKWRCSRDSVPDQKYCERHINRGRHRSRKPVEGQNNGHAIVSGSSTTSLSLSKLPSIPSSSLSSPSIAHHHPFSSMQQPNSAAAASAATDHLITRSQGFQGGLSLIPPSTAGPKSKDCPSFSTQSQQQQQQQHNVSPFVGPSQSEFGFVSSHSLLNPSEERIFSYMNTTTNNNTTTTTTTDSFLPYDPNLESNNNNQHSSSVHHFMDDWPKAHQSNRAPVSWPEELKSDWTQLSMSIPMPASSQERSTEPAHGLDPIHMGLDLGDRTHMGRDLGPVNWGNAMGGPLGEVLTSTGGAGAGDTFSSGKAGWRNSGTREIGSSPTGVLQKSTFVSLSNSSSGSSPPLSAENKKVHESSILCNDLLGSALASSAAIQSL